MKRVKRSFDPDIMKCQKGGKPMREYIVETKNLKKYYQMGANTVKALDGVDFRVKDQEFVAIIGKSGSGKSTLLHMLGGLDVPTEGEVLVEGKCLLGLKKEQLAIFRRRKIGFIFQNYNLVPDFNVYENVILPVELDGRKVDVEYVDGILELLGLAEKRKALPGTLSGGQQQRAAIARALAAKPMFLTLCLAVVAIFLVLLALNSPYLGWDYRDPETAVAGTVLHAVDWLFVRAAPFLFLGGVVGAILTKKKG